VAKYRKRSEKREDTWSKNPDHREQSEESVMENHRSVVFSLVFDNELVSFPLDICLMNRDQVVVVVEVGKVLRKIFV
jgi:hypothetical protein